MNLDGCEVEILNPEITSILIETSVSCNINNIEIERYGDYNLEVINTDVLLANNITDISVDKITGLKQYLISHLDIDKEDGSRFLRLKFIESVTNEILFGAGFNLDDYLDAYDFDGGSPIDT